MDSSRNTAVPTRSKPSRLKQFALLGAAVVFAFCLAEVAVRIVWENPYRHEGPDRIVTLRLQHAHTNHKFSRAAIHPESPFAQLRTDARSYILPSTQFAKPDCTIAFLGGSTTECCAVAEDLRFPALVSTLLAQQGLAVNTLNAGTSGNTLHDSINNLLNHVIQDEPDIVVLMHACNDIGLLSTKGSYALRAGQLVGWSDIARMSLMRISSYSSLVGLARNVARERLCYQPTAPNDLAPRPAAEPSDKLDGTFERQLRAFVRICHALEIQPVIMTQPLSDQLTPLSPDWTDQDAQARFNELIRKVGKEEDALVIDLVEYLETSVPDWREHLRVFYDGMHVNDNGSRIYAEHIAARLLPLVRAMDGAMDRDTEQRPSTIGEINPLATTPSLEVSR